MHYVHANRFSEQHPWNAQDSHDHEDFLNGILSRIEMDQGAFAARRTVTPSNWIIREHKHVDQTNEQLRGAIGTRLITDWR